MIHVRQKQDALTASPSTIRDAAKATAKREIESQKSQFRHFGIMADWSPEFTYRTLGVCRNKSPMCRNPIFVFSDRGYEIRQLRIFQKMVEKGQRTLLLSRCTEG